MKDRPILFSTPMVRALLDGSKTQTRRAMRHQPDYPVIIAGDPHTNRYQIDGREPMTEATLLRECPYGAAGDRLWVRETWSPQPDCEMTAARWTSGDTSGPAPTVHYAASPTPNRWVTRWRPSIHMPRWACRILLEVVSVRVERLNDCSETDATAEGAREWARGACAADNPHGYTEVGYYSLLWEQINGAGSWAANPWVWVVEFKRAAP